LWRSSNDPKFAKAEEEGNAPSAMDIATVQNDITSRKIAFFGYNTQTDMPTVANMAKLAEDTAFLSSKYLRRNQQEKIIYNG